MNHEDQKLFAELYILQGKLKEAKRGMRTINDKRACLCDSTGCCAWHAAIENHLESSIVSLTRAMTDLQTPRDGGL